MSTSFMLSASDDLMYPGDQLTAAMSTSNAQGLLDLILPGWDEGQGTIGCIVTSQLPACLARIKPWLSTGEYNTKRLAAVLFAAHMIGCDVVYA